MWWWKVSNMRGQSVVEYMLIVAAALTIFASIAYAAVINPSQKNSNDETLRSQARSACDSISNAINDVYSNSRGAVRTVYVQLPSEWNIYLTKNPPRLTLGVLTSQGAENVSENLRYSFDNSLEKIASGNYAVIVDWWNNEEQISMSGNRIYIYINPSVGS
jgi:Tfp pilus assembly protein PilE